MQQTMGNVPSVPGFPAADRWKIESDEMVVQGFENSLVSLKGTTVRTSDAGRIPERGIAPVDLHFSDGSRMRADYWRVICDSKAQTSSFDHQQKYGLPSPINAFSKIAEALDGRTLREARWDSRTGDVVLYFEPGVELQVFAFAGYEDWELHFSNGTGEYSPYAR